MNETGVQTDKSLWIRWMVRRDFDAVLDIERQCFEYPWSVKDFRDSISQRNVVGMVAEGPGNSLRGFMVYELPKQRIRLLNLAVHRDFRRRGFGRALVESLIAKLKQQNRKRIITEVRETNLAAQIFFRSLGFRATEVLRGFYDVMNEDAYRMEYRR